ncbi:TetR family transcriptional regulator [Algoriphagus ratkowskyi]|uniref:TetR family transcriptional regulator n=1 Tax=Algoriphagus ratkowskyi TaxID=57028 RepID=A0A2W7R507_9BACT|nr:TetR/AcrR family transcriptional regulator [Algoriphagus ratkowskyi]PZX55898.1 TetR family transcriptional regulator [Algoriphagus ratkowskyi]TXD77282.1 TetR/AcrR family transcriptional regulator [Algoriphagus ratkowskyi]
MPNKASIESKILDVAYKLFMQKGYRQTTMDDIAQMLGMSKKTLYKYYPGKLELLAASFELTRTKLTAKVEAIVENRYISFPLKLKSTLIVMASVLGPINPELFEDIREQAPDIWRGLEEYINESAYIRVKKLMEQGISEGLIKPSVNINLVVMLYASAVKSLMDPKFLAQFPDDIQRGVKISPAEMYDQAITIIYSGILTDEARNEFANA